MNRKSFSALILFLFAFAGCVPQTDVYKDSDKTGNYLYVNLSAPATGNVTLDVTENTYEIDSMGVTFVNRAIGKTGGTDIFLTSYDMTFSPLLCPSSGCPNMVPAFEVPLYLFVPKNGSASVSIPAVNDLSAIAYNSSAGGMYEVTVTFYGETAFGYPVEKRVKYPITFIFVE